MYFINFKAYNLIYDEDYIIGTFESLENQKFICNFCYVRKNDKIYDLDTNEEIDISVRWFEWKLRRQGFLNSEEYKISY